MRQDSRGPRSDLLVSRNSMSQSVMNRRMIRQILIALGVFGAIILVFVAIAQFTG